MIDMQDKDFGSWVEIFIFDFENVSDYDNDLLKFQILVERIEVFQKLVLVLFLIGRL